MRVRDVMKQRVRTVNRHESVDRAAAILGFWRFRHLPVVDHEDHVVGMLTPADLLEVTRRGGDRLDEPVSGFMRTPVVTVREEEAVHRAMQEMLARKIHALPVVDATNRIVGIVTDHDLLESFARDGGPEPALDAIPVEDVMTRSPVTVAPSSTLEEAARALLRGGFRHLPVLDVEGRLVGMLSERDVRTRLGVALPDLASAPVDALGERVADAMTPGPLAVKAGTPLAQVVETFAAERVGALPVLDASGALVGIVSYVDLLVWLRDRQPHA